MGGVSGVTDSVVSPFSTDNGKPPLVRKPSLRPRSLGKVIGEKERVRREGFCLREYFLNPESGLILKGILLQRERKGCGSGGRGGGGLRRETKT